MTNIKEDAFELQQRMSELFYSVILPVIGKIFDELAPGQQYIYLDKIEVDLGRMNARDLTSKTWELEFKEIFSKQFRDRVNIAKEKKIDLPISYSIAQQWLYYMKKGYLPWNTTSTGEEWYLKVLEGLAQDYKAIDELRVLISTDRWAVRRMVMLHDPVFLMHLVEVLTAVKQEQLKIFIESIVQLIFESDTDQPTADLPIRLRRRVWEVVLEMIVTSKQFIQPVEIMGEVLTHAFTYAENEMIDRKGIEKIELLPLLPVVKKIIEEGPLVFKEKEREKQKEKEIEKRERTKIPEEGLFVSHAGLVILHPFLNRFFSYLELINENAFKSEMKRRQAMILLHYLATGSLEFEEHELVIPKCLCNYNLEEPVDPLQLPTAEMVNECEELLRDVVSQWMVLKSTSPDGLRANFLQRSGKLYTKHDEPHLLMETSVFDVLLDRLPWGIGMIKLPWMQKVLRVEWR